MFKIWFTMILIFAVLCFCGAVMISAHKFFFKQELEDIIEDAAEEGARKKVLKEAEKLKK